MDNSDVITVNTRLESLEKIMQDVVNKMGKLNERPSFSSAVTQPAVDRSGPPPAAGGGEAWPTLGAQGGGAVGGQGKPIL